MTSIPSSLAGMLTALNPTSSQIISLFKGLALIPRDLLGVFLNSLTPAALAKLATWAEVFITNLNQVQAQAKPSPDIGDATLSTDFLTAMAATQFYGDKLTPQDLSVASNAITKAMKAENWLDGVQAGITLAQTVATFGI